MPPLLLDDEEAIAIAVGLRTAAGAAVAGIEETSVRALVKLEQVLPKHLRPPGPGARRGRPTARFPGAGPTRRPAGPDRRSRPPAATASGSASATRRATAPATRRLVEPLSLVNLGRRWYLVAWDCGREDWRTFRLDRIDRPRRRRRALRRARAARRRRPGASTWRQPVERARSATTPG